MRRLACLAAAFAFLAACSDSGTLTSTTRPSTTLPTNLRPSTTQPPATTTTPPTTQPAPTYAATIDELLTLGRPIVLAHTGGEDEFPGSTLFAFGESVNAGVDMLDLNVQLTKDGVLVVQHDDSVDGNTDGTGKVADLTYAEIAAFDAAYWFTADCGVCHDQPDTAYAYRGMRTGAVSPPDGYSPDDFALPTFRQLVERFPDIPLNIEIKGEGEPAKAAADVLAKELQELGREHAAVMASFEDEIVSYFHQIAPDVEVAPATGAMTAWVLSRTPLAEGMRILQLPPYLDDLQVITPELIAASTAAGYPIWIWPNNRDFENLATYRDYLDAGIQGLNINFPEQGVQAVREFDALAGLAAPAASSGCDAETAALPGDSIPTLSAAGLDGRFMQHLPPAYDGATPLPVVVDLHGWLQTAELQQLESGLAPFGDLHRFILITPDLVRPVSLWNPQLDGEDMTWMTTLLDTIESTLCTDTSRLFVAGMSNGAMMASAMACAMADRVAAVAPVSGLRAPTDCEPERAVPVITMHGTDDPYLTFTGGYGPKVADLPTPDGTGTFGDDAASISGEFVDVAGPVPEMVAAWAARNGCRGEPSETTIAADVRLTSWDDCNGADAHLYTVQGGGHSWPGSTFDQAISDYVGVTTTSIDANDIIWEFFRAHPLATG